MNEMTWFIQGLTVEAIGVVVEVVLIVFILQAFRDRRRKRLLQPALQRSLLRIRRDALAMNSGFEVEFEGAHDESSASTLVDAVGDLEVRLDQLIVSSHDLLSTKLMRRLIEVHRIIAAVVYVIDSEVQELDPQRRRAAVAEFVATAGQERLKRLLEKLTSSLHLLAI